MLGYLELVDDFFDLQPDVVLALGALGRARGGKDDFVE
jgi:hypothetical protein